MKRAMPVRESASFVVVVTAVFVMISCGDLDPPGSQNPVPGKLWRWSADGATGMVGTVTVPVLSIVGDSIYRDHCICVNYHALLTAVVDGLTEIGPGSQVLLDSMRDETIEACENRAVEMGLSSSLHVSCSMGTCEVGEELVEWAIDHPEEFMLSNGGVMARVSVTGGGFGYEFTTVPSGSLADELGFVVDDVVTEINNQEVGELENWSTIVGSLVDADTATVTYLRGGTEHTLLVTLDE